MSDKYVIYFTEANQPLYLGNSHMC